MSLYLDEKYLALISNRLDQFKKVRDDLWNFRCPVCGDSHKDKLKARGYLYTFNSADGLVFKCHNCSASFTFSKLLKMVDPSLYKRYLMEVLKDKKYISPIKNNNVEVFRQTNTFKFHETRLDSLIKVDQLPENHICKQYVINRKIPKEFWSSLYYAEDFVSFTNSLIPGKIRSHEKQGRLVIPYLDKQGKMFAYAGRALGESSLRYYIIKLDESMPKIFGLDRVKTNRTIYCCEGQIDSLFLPNSLAVGGSNYGSSFLKEVAHNIVIVPDNDKGNPQVLSNIKQAINLNYRVVIWPKTFEYKDINEAIMDGMSVADLMSIINENTFSGVMATVKLSVNQSRI